MNPLDKMTMKWFLMEKLAVGNVGVDNAPAAAGATGKPAPAAPAATPAAVPAAPTAVPTKANPLAAPAASTAKSGGGGGGSSYDKGQISQLADLTKQFPNWQKAGSQDAASYKAQWQKLQGQWGKSPDAGSFAKGIVGSNKKVQQALSNTPQGAKMLGGMGLKALPSTAKGTASGAGATTGAAVGGAAGTGSAAAAGGATAAAAAAFKKKQQKSIGSPTAPSVTPGASAGAVKVAPVAGVSGGSKAALGRAAQKMSAQVAPPKVQPTANPVVKAP
jgi:hypothetical protein